MSIGLEVLILSLALAVVYLCLRVSNLEARLRTFESYLEEGAE
jgi:hypothetical protein